MSWTPGSSLKEKYCEKVLLVLVSIEENLRDELSLQQLAAVADCSPYHFHRIFAAATGEGLMGYVRKRRLERAYNLLRRGTKSIGEIAHECGFSSHQSFNRAFRQQFGSTPSEIRSEKGPGVTGDAANNFRKLLTKSMELTKGFNAEIRHIQARRVAFMHHSGHYSEVRPMFRRLLEWAAGQDLDLARHEVYGVAHNTSDIYEDESIRFDACITVPEDFEISGDVGIQSVWGGCYAVALHKGPFERFRNTYRMLVLWGLETGYELAGDAAIITYLNNPFKLPPEEWRAEVAVPLDPILR